MPQVAKSASKVGKSSLQFVEAKLGFGTVPSLVCKWPRHMSTALPIFTVCGSAAVNLYVDKIVQRIPGVEGHAIG